jgi:hypothetical protein
MCLKKTIFHDVINKSNRIVSVCELGTYSMKLLGEGYINGNVGFSSQEPSGTTFHVSLKI